MRGGSDGSGSGLDVGISGDLACMISSSHDLEVRAWISRMQRLSARAQGSKGSDSKPSMSAIRLLQQQGGAWQCGAVRAGAVRRQQRASMCTRKERGRERVVCTLDRRARVEHYSASRGGIPCHAGRGEGSASGGSLSFVRAAAAASGRRQRSARQDCLPPRCRGVSLSFTHASLLLAPLSVNYTFFTRVF